MSPLRELCRCRRVTGHEVVIELIGATTTTMGLTVHAERDTDTYPKGVKASDEELASVSLKPHDFHGEWNYTASWASSAPEATSYPRVVAATLFPRGPQPDDLRPAARQKLRQVAR